MNKIEIDLVKRVLSRVRQSSWVGIDVRWGKKSWKGGGGSVSMKKTNRSSRKWIKPQEVWETHSGRRADEAVIADGSHEKRGLLAQSRKHTEKEGARGKIKTSPRGAICLKTQGER